MQALRLRLLGTPEVSYGDQPVKLPTRKALALLIYLVVEGGFHSREKLVALFWPESAASLGFAALRNTLARLRAAVHPTEPLRADHDGLIAFDFATRSTLDLQLVEAAVQTSTTDQPDIAVLQAAVTAYRADFLEGFSLADAPAFDDWASFQRERWHYQMNNVFEALSRLQSERRAFDHGLAIALRWVAHDPLNEAAYRRLMQLHAMKGDYTAALQTYTTCRATLRLELGIEPGAETNALVERIRRLHDADGGMIASVPPPLPPRIFRPSSLKDLPFVGRAGEHAQLAARYQALGQGQTSVVVIHGEAGIGKTRLVMEFLNWLAVQPVDVLRGRAFEAGGRLPYQPIVEALRQRLEQENAPDDLLSDVWLAELSRLLPELRDRYPDLPPPTADETLARIRLPEAVTRLGQTLATRCPLVLFIDDVQWADAASLDLLHYLARAWSAGGVAVLFLFTLRTEALGIDPALEAWLSSLERDISLIRLSLEPLSAEETEQLASRLVGERDSDGACSPTAFADWLFSETAGQPLFITESLKTLLEQGFLHLRTDAAGRSIVDFTGLTNSEGSQLSALQRIVPSGVRQVILARLKRLTTTATTLLTAAAVMGRDCSFEQLRQVADLSEREALPALDELLNSRLLLETNDVAHPYRFTHDKIRAVVYSGAGDAWRRVYHRRTFQMLETMLVPPAELAHHAHAARLIEPAFRYSIAGGDADMALFAIPNAIIHYEQARSLIAKLSPPMPKLHHLYAQLGRAYELRGEYEQAEAICQEMLAQARTTQQPPMACAALNRLASLAIYSQQMEQATTILVEARQIAEASGDTAGLAQTEWSLGQLTHHIDDFLASKRHSERALALARELDDPALIAGASSTLAYALVFLGQVEAATDLMEAARAGYVAVGNCALEADALVGLTIIHLLNGKLDASIAAARAAYTISQEIENAFGQATSQAWLVCGLVDRGDYEEALAIVRRNLTAVRSQKLILKMLAAFSAGLVYWAVGDAEAAVAVHHEIHPLLVEANVPGYLEENAAHLCVDAALDGDWQTAHHYARQALSHRDYQGLPQFIAPHWPETEALLRGGDIELAREDARRWGELIGHIPRYRPLHLRSLALLAEWEGNAGHAIAYIEEAYSLAEAMDLPGEQWRMLVKLGELYQVHGNEDQVGQAQRKAKEIVQALASKIADEHIRLEFLATAQSL